MPCFHDNEEHELPVVEAVLAGTLVLMTGYSQSLQADLGPERRCAMDEKIVDNLGVLANHPGLTPAFRQLMLGLQRRWTLMSDCTRRAALAPERPELSTPAWVMEAPKSLQ